MYVCVCVGGGGKCSKRVKRFHLKNETKVSVEYINKEFRM